MRLIDADELMDRLRGNVLIDVTPELEEVIIQHPTAFDRANVIEEIRKRVGTCKMEHCKRYDYDCDECRAGEAIEIVEKGVIE